MKTRTRILFLLGGLTLGSVVAVSQQEDANPWSATVRLGRTSFEMTEVRSLMNEGIAWYNSSGVRVNLQVDFPPNYVFGVEASRRFGKYLVGAGYAASNTMAFAGYRDGAGLMRLKAEATFTNTYAIVGMWDHLPFVPWIEGYAVIKVGSLSGKITTEETVSFIGLNMYDVDVDTEGESKGLSFEFALGAETGVYGPVVAGIEAGRRSATIDELPLWSSPKKHRVSSQGNHLTLYVGYRW